MPFRSSISNPISISAIIAHEFDQFITYLNDHLSDNGKHDGIYFQPMSRNESRLPPEREAVFLAGLSLPVGEIGWRRLWAARLPDGHFTGHIDLRSHADRFAGHRCLLGMGVDREYRNMGLGLTLLKHAETWAKADAAIEWIDLQVLSENNAAIRLYEKFGFKKTGETPAMFKIDGRFLSYSSMSKNIGA